MTYPRGQLLWLLAPTVKNTLCGWSPWKAKEKTQIQIPLLELRFLLNFFRQFPSPFLESVRRALLLRQLGLEREADVEEVLLGHLLGDLRFGRGKISLHQNHNRRQGRSAEGNPRALRWPAKSSS